MADGAMERTGLGRIETVARRVLSEAVDDTSVGPVSVAALLDGGSACFIIPRDGNAGGSVGIRDRFLVYSITKTFIAAAVLRLAQKGALDVDGPVSGWLPDVPNARLFTPRHLMSHTSGLPDYGGLEAYHRAVLASEPAWTPERYFSETKSDRLLFRPGEGWAYSNIGYMVLRLLLEKLTGASFADALAGLVLEPSGLSDTFVAGDADLASLAFGQGPWFGEAAETAVARRYSVGWVAHGVAASTAKDVARFYHELFRGDFLSKEQLDAMIRLRIFPAIAGRPYKSPGYGLGIQAEAAFPGGPAYGHTGGGPGACGCCFTAMGPNERVTVAVLMAGEAAPVAERIVLETLRTLCMGETYRGLSISP